jgi:flagellar export protein FliJ
MLKFRFNRLMEVKEKVLEHRKRELETALAVANMLSERIHAIEREVAFHHKDMAVRCLTGREFSLLISHLAYLDGEKTTVTRELKRADGLVDTLRKELSALAVELKMFEKLKSKAVHGQRKRDRKKEQKMLDELALRIEGT